MQGIQVHSDNLTLYPLPQTVHNRQKDDSASGFCLRLLLMFLQEKVGPAKESSPIH